MVKREELIEKLHRYDTMRRELMALERELSREVTIYGKKVHGATGFRIDHLRLEVRAEQAMWEMDNA